MTRSEMKVYLEGIWEKWHNDQDYNWNTIWEEVILKEEQINLIYSSDISINGEKEVFVNGLLRGLYPTKLEKALR